MGNKISTVCAREELAARLEDMAAQLRMGSLHFGSESMLFPEQLKVKSSIKEKKHAVVCKLEWRWAPLVARLTDESRDEAPSLPSRFKQIKKDLARSFRALKRAVNQGITPDDQLLAEFDSLSRAFAEQAEPEWEKAAREYLGHMENLFRAIRDNIHESAIHEIHDLQARMVACHKEYK